LTISHVAASSWPNQIVRCHDGNQTLTFISSAFVPVESMPGALKWFAEISPFTIIVDAMRALWVGQPAGNRVWGAVVWSLAIIAVFAPLAVARYRRAAGS